MKSWKWGRLGATASLAVMLSEAGRQLDAIETANARAYGTAAFTGPKAKVWDRETLSGAFNLWLDTDQAPAARALLNWHVGLDLLFLCLLASLAAQLLHALAVPIARRRAAVLTYLVVDGLETLVTGAVVNLGRPDWLLVTLQVLTLVKWIALADVVLLAITSPRVQGGFNVSGFRYAGTVPSNAVLTGQWVLVAIFAALIAVPGGGPLEQLPDILRQQLADLDETFVLSSLSLIGLVAAVIVSGAVGRRAAAAGSPTTRSRSVIVVGAVLTAVLCTVQAVREEWTMVTLAPAIVLSTVQLLAWWRDWLAPAEMGATPPEMVTEEAIAEVGATPAEMVDGEDPATAEPTATMRLGALGGAVAMLGGLGLVRATTPYLVLGLPGVRWWVFCGFGIATAITSVGVARWLLGALAPLLGATLRQRILVSTPIGVAVAAGALAVAPMRHGGSARTGCSPSGCRWRRWSSPGFSFCPAGSPCGLRPDHWAWVNAHRGGCSPPPLRRRQCSQHGRRLSRRSCQGG